MPDQQRLTGRHVNRGESCAQVGVEELLERQRGTDQGRRVSGVLADHDPTDRHQRSDPRQRRHGGSRPWRQGAGREPAQKREDGRGRGRCRGRVWRRDVQAGAWLYSDEDDVASDAATSGGDSDVDAEGVPNQGNAETSEER